MDYFKEASLGWSSSVVLPSSTLNQGNESIFSLVFVVSLKSVSFRFFFFFSEFVFGLRKKQLSPQLTEPSVIAFPAVQVHMKTSDLCLEKPIFILSLQYWRLEIVCFS